MFRALKSLRAPLSTASVWKGPFLQVFATATHASTCKANSRGAHSSVQTPDGADRAYAALASHMRGIPVAASNIDLLQGPEEFYQSLMDSIRTAERRIVLASLYIGTEGKRERALVAALASALRARPDLRCTILVDALRGTRRSAHSQSCADFLADSLIPAAAAGAPGRLSVHLYQTPKLRGPLKRALPPRWNEIVGVSHVKAVVADDDVIMTGANMSETYFTVRQDRYMRFRVEPQLAAEVVGLVDSLAACSYTLTERRGPSGLSFPEGVPHPEHRPSAFRSHFASTAGSLFLPDSPPSAEGTAAARRDAGGQASTSRSSFDYGDDVALVMPAVQAGSLGVHQDEMATLALLRAAAQGGRLQLASAYLNLPPQYEKALAHSPAALEMLTAGPEQHGWAGAKGAGAIIPAAYAVMEERLLRRFRWSRSGSFQLLEYRRPNWQFHVKGIWYSAPGEETPCATAVGSPNFGAQGP